MAIRQLAKSFHIFCNPLQRATIIMVIWMLSCYILRAVQILADVDIMKLIYKYNSIVMIFVLIYATKIFNKNAQLATAWIMASITAIMIAFLLMQAFFTVIREVDIVRVKPYIVVSATELLIIFLIAITFSPGVI